MSEASDERLRRLFAEAPAVPADEAFVARVAADIGAQRRARHWLNIGAVALLAALAFVAVQWMAPWFSSAGAALSSADALLHAPEMVMNAVASAGARDFTAVPWWLYVVVAAGVLPLAGTAWLVRRFR